MAFDIKKTIEEIVNKVKNDKDIGEKFKKNPTGTVEGLIGVDLPDDQINAVVEGVKAKVNLDNISGIADKLGGLYGKCRVTPARFSIDRFRHSAKNGISVKIPWHRMRCQGIFICVLSRDHGSSFNAGHFAYAISRLMLLLVEVTVRVATDEVTVP